MLGPICGFIVAFAITQYIKRRQIIHYLSIIQKREEECVRKDVEAGVPSVDAVDEVLKGLEE